jgi:hypothetical protein
MRVSAPSNTYTLPLEVSVLDWLSWNASVRVEVIPALFWRVKLCTTARLTTLLFDITDDVLRSDSFRPRENKQHFALLSPKNRDHAEHVLSDMNRMRGSKPYSVSRIDSCTATCGCPVYGLTISVCFPGF